MIGKVSLGSYPKGILDYCLFESVKVGGHGGEDKKRIDRSEIRGEVVYSQNLDVDYDRAGILDTASLQQQFVEVGEKTNVSQVEKYVWHQSFSFPKDEEVTPQLIRSVCEEFAEHFGLEANQMIVFRHYDTAHPHFHVVANRIDNIGKCTAEHFNNYIKTGRFARLIEQKHDLSITKSMYADRIDGKLQEIIDANPAHDRLRERIDFHLIDSKNLGELSKSLQHEGIKVTVGAGVSFVESSSGIAMKGSALGRGYSKANLEKRIAGTYVEERPISLESEPGKLDTLKSVIDRVVPLSKDWSDYRAKMLEVGYKVEAVSTKEGKILNRYTDLSLDKITSGVRMGKLYSDQAIEEGFGQDRASFVERYGKVLFERAINQYIEKNPDSHLGNLLIHLRKSGYESLAMDEARPNVALFSLAGQTLCLDQSKVIQYWAKSQAVVLDDVREMETKTKAIELLDKILPRVGNVNELRDQLAIVGFRLERKIDVNRVAQMTNLNSYTLVNLGDQNGKEEVRVEVDRLGKLYQGKLLEKSFGVERKVFEQVAVRELVEKDMDDLISIDNKVSPMVLLDALKREGYQINHHVQRKTVAIQLGAEKVSKSFKELYDRLDGVDFRAVEEAPSISKLKNAIAEISPGVKTVKEFVAALNKSGYENYQESPTEIKYIDKHDRKEYGQHELGLLYTDTNTVIESLGMERKEVVKEFFKTTLAGELKSVLVQSVDGEKGLKAVSIALKAKGYELVNKGRDDRFAISLEGIEQPIKHSQLMDYGKTIFDKALASVKSQEVLLPIWQRKLIKAIDEVVIESKTLVAFSQTLEQKGYFFDGKDSYTELSSGRQVKAETLGVLYGMESVVERLGLSGDVSTKVAWEGVVQSKVARALETNLARSPKSELHSDAWAKQLKADFKQHDLQIGFEQADELVWKVSDRITGKEVAIHKLDTGSYAARYLEAKDSKIPAQAHFEIRHAIHQVVHQQDTIPSFNQLLRIYGYNIDFESQEVIDLKTKKRLALNELGTAYQKDTLVSSLSGTSGAVFPQYENVKIEVNESLKDSIQRVDRLCVGLEDACVNTKVGDVKGFKERLQEKGIVIKELGQYEFEGKLIAERDLGPNYAFRYLAEGLGENRTKLVAATAFKAEIQKAIAGNVAGLGLEVDAVSFKEQHRSKLAQKGIVLSTDKVYTSKVHGLTLKDAELELQSQYLFLNVTKRLNEVEKQDFAQSIKKVNAIVDKTLGDTLDADKVLANIREKGIEFKAESNTFAFANFSGIPIALIAKDLRPDVWKDRAGKDRSRYRHELRLIQHCKDAIGKELPRHTQLSSLEKCLTAQYGIGLVFSNATQDFEVRATPPITLSKERLGKWAAADFLADRLGKSETEWVKEQALKTQINKALDSWIPLSTDWEVLKINLAKKDIQLNIVENERGRKAITYQVIGTAEVFTGKQLGKSDFTVEDSFGMSAVVYQAIVQYKVQLGEQLEQYLPQVRNFNELKNTMEKQGHVVKASIKFDKPYLTFIEPTTQREIPLQILGRLYTTDAMEQSFGKPRAAVLGKLNFMADVRETLETVLPKTKDWNHLGDMLKQCNIGLGANHVGEKLYVDLSKQQSEVIKGVELGMLYEDASVATSMGIDRGTAKRIIAGAGERSQANQKGDEGSAVNLFKPKIIQSRSDAGKIEKSLDEKLDISIEEEPKQERKPSRRMRM